MYFPPSTFSWDGWGPVLRDFGSSSAGVLCWLGHLHCWPATACPVPHPPLLGLPPSSSCSCHRALAVLAQCLHSACPAPAPLALSLPLHPRLLPKGFTEHSGVGCNASLQQGYSSSKRRVIYPLDITYTGLCFAICVFRGFTAVMAAQYWLDLIFC